MSLVKACAGGLFGLLVPSVGLADWYSGDPYTEQTTWPQFTENLSTPAQVLAMTFDNFSWTPGAGAGIVDVVGGHFHNFQSYPNPTSTVDTAYWEIRTGMGVGVAGTLVASGSGIVTNFTTAFTQGGWEVGGVSVDVPNFLLPAGSYWFGLAIGSTNAQSSGWFIASTHGANGVGGPLGDDVELYYQESNATVSWNYVDGSVNYPPGSTGFDPSYWINEVPAPGASTLSIFLVIGAARRRR